MNIFDLCLPVIGVADGPIVEADLPDFHFLVTRFADLVGAASLDELLCFFKTHCRAWRQHEVQMVGHDDEFVQEICASLTIVKEGFD